jgi:flavin reductase (DIM6/NTAB) family NADH-FMN oxidoreductase RutF
MKQIEPSEFKENIFETIGKEWMLITGGTKECFNMMTASWGGIGWLWNKPVAFIFIRPERYTYEFLKKNRKLSLSFLGKEEEARKIYTLCGSKSGRDLDKVKESGLKPVFTETDGITYEQARMTLECQQLYEGEMRESDFLDPEILKNWYGEKKGNLHKVIVAEIEHIWINE